MKNVREKYEIIYADPPWQFKVWSDKGNGRSAEKHYSTQNQEYLKNLNISAISKPNSVLLMWATFPCLQDALQLGASWGFTYKTVAFTWIKKNIKNNNLFLGMGYYTRANAEIVLLFTKGKPLVRKARNVPQVIVTHRRRHSEKPDEIRQRIVSLFGDVSKVELFAREKTNPGEAEVFTGWDVFGNEIGNSIELPD